MYNACARYGLLITLLLATWLVLTPGTEELQTILILVLVEVIAVGLSALAVYSFTKIDFTFNATKNLGFIFLGVHICVGLTVLAV